MDSNTPFSNMTLVIAAASFVLAFLTQLVIVVVWLIRVEAKVNASIANIAKNELRNEETIKSLDRHRDNTDIHFNLRTAQEVEKRQEARFTGIERELHEIKELVKELAK